MEANSGSSTAGPGDDPPEMASPTWYTPTCDVKEECPIYRAWCAILYSTPGNIDYWDDYDLMQHEFSQLPAHVASASVPHADDPHQGVEEEEKGDDSRPENMTACEATKGDEPVLCLEEKHAAPTRTDISPKTNAGQLVDEDDYEILEAEFATKSRDVVDEEKDASPTRTDISPKTNAGQLVDEDDYEILEAEFATAPRGVQAAEAASQVAPCEEKVTREKKDAPAEDDTACRRITRLDSGSDEVEIWEDYDILVSEFSVPAKAVQTGAAVAESARRRRVGACGNGPVEHVNRNQSKGTGMADRGVMSCNLRSKSSHSSRQVAKGSTAASEGARRRTATVSQAEDDPLSRGADGGIDEVEEWEDYDILVAEFSSPPAEIATEGAASEDPPCKRNDAVRVSQEGRREKQSVGTIPVLNGQRKRRQRKRKRPVSGNGSDEIVEECGLRKVGIEPSAPCRSQSTRAQHSGAAVSPPRVGTISLIEEKDDDRDTCVSNDDHERGAEETRNVSQLDQVAIRSDIPVEDLGSVCPVQGDPRVSNLPDDVDVLFVSRERASSPDSHEGDSSPDLAPRQRTLTDLYEMDRERRERLIKRARCFAGDGKCEDSLRLYSRVLEFRGEHQTIESEVREVASVVLSAGVTEKDWAAVRDAIYSWNRKVGRESREGLINRARRSARDGKREKALRLYSRVLNYHGEHEAMECEVREVASAVLSGGVAEKDWAAVRDAVISWKRDASRTRVAIDGGTTASSSGIIIID